MEIITTNHAMAKLYASVAMEQTVEVAQIHGGYGFVKEYHVERLMRCKDYLNIRELKFKNCNF